MILPLPVSKKLLNLPPFFHPNLLEKIRIGEHTYLLGKEYRDYGNIEAQRKALAACLFKAFGVGVRKFFELSNRGFFLGYPSLEGTNGVEDFVGAPVFSKIGWFPFKNRELLFILRAIEEKANRRVFSLTGPEGVGKSWVIRRVVDFSPEGILLNGKWKNLEKLAERILREKRWRVIGIENFGMGNTREIFRVLSLALNEAVFLLEGQFDIGYTLRVEPPEIALWMRNLVTLDEEARETALSLLRENACPGELIKGLLKGKGEDARKLDEKVDPEIAVSFTDKIKNLMDQGEYERVIEITDKERGDEIKAVRAQAFLSLGEREEAEKILRRCRTKLCRALNSYLKGMEFIPEPDNSPEIFLWAGKVAEKREDFLLAEALYRRGYSRALSEFDSRMAGLIASDLGAFFFRQGDINQAEEFFRNSLWLLSSSSSPRAYTISCFNLGEVLFIKGQWLEAERMYKISYRESLKSPLSLSHGYDCASLGYLVFLKGDFSKGRELLYKAWEIFSKQGTKEERSDVAMKIFEYSLDRGEFPEDLMKLHFLYPAEELRRFFAGEDFQGSGPWSLLLYGLRKKDRKLILKAASKFASERKEGEENFCYYLLGKFELWRRSDAGKLKKALRWYRRRGSFRAEVIEKFLRPEETKADVRLRTRGEEDVFEEIFTLSLDRVPGKFRGFFLMDDEGNLLLKKATPSIPWILIRNFTEAEVCNDTSRCERQELKEELFLRGVRSYIIAGENYGRGKIIGFVGDVLENSFSSQELVEMESLLKLVAREMEPRKEFVFLKGSSWEMRKVYFSLRKAASHEYPVLIQGETGTGKEVAARSIHELRKKGNFVAINCAAIPESLLESELFGYKAGAFTGATKDKPGLVEETEGGILFLDEVSEIPYVLQAKLLRVLQEKKVRRLGDTVEREVKFKLISASNRDLFELVERGEFRRDLFYRISTQVIDMPSLRTRKEDILPLAIFLAERSAGVRIDISREARRLLLNYSWPGNVRELESVIKSAVAVMEEGETLLLPQHLPSYIKSGESTFSLEDARNLWERNYVLAVLEANSWEISRAASELGISRQHLYNLIRKHRIK